LPLDAASLLADARGLVKALGKHSGTGSLTWLVLHMAALRMAEPAGLSTQGWLEQVVQDAAKGDLGSLCRVFPLEGLGTGRDLEPSCVRRVGLFWLERDIGPGDAGILGYLYDCLHWDERAARKRRGLFYTPPHLARHMVEGCLGPLAECWDAAAGPLRFLDPACGGGTFLIEALRWFQRVGPPGLSLCLYGVDVDALAASVARFSLRLLTQGGTGVTCQVKVGDSLVWPGGAEVPPGVRGFDYGSQFPEVSGAVNPGFHAVATNPPWVRLKDMGGVPEGLSRYFQARYRLQKGNLNLYKLFWERCLELVCDGGFCALMHPATFLGEDQSVLLRRRIFEGATVIEVLQFTVPDMKGFFGGGPVMEGAVTLVKKEPSGDYVFRLGSGPGLRAFELSRARLEVLTRGRYEVPNPGVTGECLRLIERLSAHPRFDQIIEMVGEGPFHETADVDLASWENTGHILLRGIHVRRYRVDLRAAGRLPPWVNRQEFLARRPAAITSTARRPVLIGRQMVHRGEARRLHFALLETEAVLSNGVRYLFPREGVDPWHVLGLLNSSLLDWRFSVFSRTFNTKPYELRSLPLAPVTHAEGIASLAQRITHARGAGDRDVEARLAAALDCLVYDAYGLEEGEISLVEPCKRVLPSVDESRRLALY
jgi:hypothetical protein